jgi:hypothetical protein
VELVCIQLGTDRHGRGNGSTDYTHETSLFFVQLSALAGKEFLFEQKIRTREMVVDAADKQSPSAREHVDDFPAFQSMIL